MADISVAIVWTCGKEMHLSRNDDGVGVVLPHRSFALEPAKAILVAKVISALAEYPTSPTTERTEHAE